MVKVGIIDPLKVVRTDLVDASSFILQFWFLFEVSYFNTIMKQFIQMQRHDALKDLDIYRKDGEQAERLSEFYEACKFFLGTYSFFSSKMTIIRKLDQQKELWENRIKTFEDI